MPLNWTAMKAVMLIKKNANWIILYQLHADLMFTKLLFVITVKRSEVHLLQAERGRDLKLRV